MLALKIWFAHMPLKEGNGPEQADHLPSLSIGLAVYNGEEFLREAIESILGQTYTDFELIISDNASTDRTADICLEFARKDKRIRYYRNAQNIGGAANENLTFELARAPYFRWAAHDDVLAPRLLEACCEVLDHNPDVVLCHSQTVIIDQYGIHKSLISRNRANCSRPAERFVTVTPLDHNCEETYGVIRTEALRKTGLQQLYTDSDRTLLAHLSLMGKFHEVPEPLFYKRYHPAMSTQVYPNWRERSAWFGGGRTAANSYPFFAQLRHYLEIIATTPIPMWQKLLCFRHMLYWVMRYRRWLGLCGDISLAFHNGIRRTIAWATPARRRGLPN